MKIEEAIRYFERELEKIEELKLSKQLRPNRTKKCCTLGVTSVRRLIWRSRHCA